MFFLKTFFGSYIILKKNQYLDKQLKKNYFDIIDIMFYFVQTIVEAFNQLRLCVVGLLLFVCLFGLFLKRFFFWRRQVMLCIQQAIEPVTNCQLSFFVSMNEPGFLFFNLQSNQVRYDGSVNFSSWDVVVLNIYMYQQHKCINPCFLLNAT